MVHENNELRHKVVYIGSRCEQVEAELTQTKEYLNSEIRKANDKTEEVKKEKVCLTSWCISVFKADIELQ